MDREIYENIIAIHIRIIYRDYSIQKCFFFDKVSVWEEVEMNHYFYPWKYKEAQYKIISNQILL